LSQPQQIRSGFFGWSGIFAMGCLLELNRE
jgi:hypothetical protein